MVAADTVFDTPRLRARRIGPGDVEAMFAVYGDPEVTRWVGDGEPLARQGCEQWVGVTHENYRRRGYGMFALELKATGEVVGFCGLVHPANQPEPEIKYAFRRSAWGRGLASEAAAALLAYGAHVHALALVIATVAPENRASQAVLLKAGMQLGPLRANADGSQTQLFTWHGLADPGDGSARGPAEPAAGAAPAAQPPREVHLSGPEALHAATALLRRVRRAHPTAGLLEAADVQWWSRSPRATDDVRQLFWLDELGRPAAAVIATDWGEAVSLDPVVLPGAPAEWVVHVVTRGLAHARACGFDAVDVVIDAGDDMMRALLQRHGFVPAQDDPLALTEAWLAADRRPPVSPLAEPYRLQSRLETQAHGAHHMARRSGADVEARLRQTSLYRADLDLLVLDAGGAVVAYGLFWFDAQTATGLVEPMRTEDGHQGRGLGRHVLTAGIHRLAGAGARRIKICFRPGNAPARALYLGVGFEPVKETVVFSGRAGAA